MMQNDAGTFPPIFPQIDILVEYNMISDTEHSLPFLHKYTEIHHIHLVS